MKRMLMTTMLLTAVVAVAFAGGRAEVDPVELTGTVTLLTDQDGDLYAVLTNEDGEYRLNIPPGELTELALTDGQTITVDGYLVGNADRPKVMATAVSQGDETYVIKEPEAGLTLRERARLRDQLEDQPQVREENQTQTERSEDGAHLETRTRTSR